MKARLLKSLFAMLACICMALTCMPITVHAAYTVTGSTAAVSTLADLQAALADTSVSEIIIENRIDLANGTNLNGNGKTVRAETTGLNENGVGQSGSEYNVFYIDHSNFVSISNMTIMGGSRSAIINYGQLIMENVTITRSGKYIVPNYEWNIYCGGAIQNYASLVLQQCSILRCIGSYAGGILNSGGTVIMDRCSLSENRSVCAGGGAAENKTSNAKMYINNSVISNNTSYEIGGGINNYQGTLYLMNSTVTGNATTVGSKYGGGIGNNGGSLYAVNSIISDNVYCSLRTSDVSLTDIGYGGNNFLYNSIYGKLIVASLSDDIGNSYNTTGIFAGTRSFGVLAGDGTTSTSAFNHPVLIKTNDGRLYAPLASSSDATSIGAYQTYFNYSDLSNIKMSYKATEDSAMTDLTGQADEADAVTTYIEGGTRTSGVVGASGPSLYRYYTVTVNTSSNGTSLGGSIYGDTYIDGTSVTLTAVPDSGYYFSCWTIFDNNGTAIVAANPYTFTVTKDVTISPVFTTTPSFTVTLNAADGITGFEFSSNSTNGIDGDWQEYTGPITTLSGSSQYIKAVMDPDYAFVKWADGITDNPYQIADITSNISYSPSSILKTYGISLSPDGDKIFTSATVGYDETASHAVSITNTGSQPTGDLSVTLSDSIAGDFTLSKSTINSLSVGGTDSFTVHPNIGLAVGTYSGSVTVSGSQNISHTFNICFIVNPVPTYIISLDPSADQTFASAIVGYEAQTPQTITVTNMGNQPTGDLTVTLSGTDEKNFKLSKDAISSLAVNGSDTFSIAPSNGLAAGTYSAKLTVNGSHNICKSFNVSFTVDPIVSPDYIVSIDDSYTLKDGHGSYKPGDIVTLDAGERTGYTFIGWTSDDIVIDNAGHTTVSFTMPLRAVTVTANWSYTGSSSEDTSPSNKYHIITASAGTGGFISPSGPVTVRQESNQIFNITPDNNHVIEDVLVDGISVKDQVIDNKYTFQNIQEAHTIEVTFADKSISNPDTGDMNNAAWPFVMCISLAGCAAMVLIKRRMKHTQA